MTAESQTASGEILARYVPRDVLVAILVNMAMGLLYIWGLFLIPLGESLSIKRAALSLVPAFALVSFTVGMVVHDRLLTTLGRVRFALLAFALAGGGHLLFAAVGTYWSLILGYGLAFGFGAGLGYGLALALATHAGASRALSIGLVMAAFAVSGVILPAALGPLIRNSAPAASFAGLGIGLLIIAVPIAFLLSRNARPPAPEARSAVPLLEAVDLFSPDFIRLALLFFLICYVGLMVVSHGTGIATSHSLPARIVELSPSLFTLGYLGGSIGGGWLVERLNGGRALIAASAVAALGVALLATSSVPLALAGSLAVGATFGSSASLMPTLIGERYGPDRIGAVYGKMMISYGLAGLLAPWFTGLLFDAAGNYGAALAIGFAMSIVSLLLGFTLLRKPPAPVPV